MLFIQNNIQNFNIRKKCCLKTTAELLNFYTRTSHIVFFIGEFVHTESFKNVFKNTLSSEINLKKHNCKKGKKYLTTFLSYLCIFNLNIYRVFSHFTAVIIPSLGYCMDLIYGSSYITRFLIGRFNLYRPWMTSGSTKLNHR